MVEDTIVPFARLAAYRPLLPGYLSVDGKLPLFAFGFGYRIEDELRGEEEG